MPDVNALPVTPHSRFPRGAVKLNGTLVVGWEEIEVDNNAFRAADTFRVAFALHGLPQGYGADWFGSQTTIDCEIFVTDNPADPVNYQPSEADSLILGQVDDIDLDFLGGSITLSGRDWTAKLIDTKTNENFLNKTASDVATILAGRHGLTPVVTKTTAKVGSYYSQNHMSLTQERSEWDILADLARFENFDVYVKGRELHFGPKLKDSGHYVIEWDASGTVPASNVISIQFSRSLTIAKGVVVTVRSWNAKQKKAFDASWPKAVKSTKPGQSGQADPIKYHYTIAGLTQDQALQEARRRYDMIVAHMMNITADLPGDSLLDCTKIVVVRGTGTAWDQNYYPDSVNRTLSADEGYRMALTAKNVSSDIEDQN